MWTFIVKVKVVPRHVAVTSQRHAAASNAKKQRILCVVTFETMRDGGAAAVWLDHVVPHCDGYRFFTSEAELLRNDTQKLFTKTKNYDKRFWERRRLELYDQLLYLYDHELEKYEWFVRVPNPYTLLLVDNLRALLTRRQDNALEDAVYLGHRLEFGSNHETFNYALGTTVMSRKFVEAYGSNVDAQLCTSKLNKENSHSSDDFSQQCLGLMSAHIDDTRDVVGREHFQAFQVIDHYEKMQYADDWYWRGKNTRNVQEDCCAEYPVAFHNYKNIHNLDLLYTKIEANVSDLGLISIKPLVAIHHELFQGGA